MTAETGTYRWMAPEIPYDNMTPLQAALGVRQELENQLRELKADKHVNNRDANFSQAVEALRRLFPGVHALSWKVCMLLVAHMWWFKQFKLRSPMTLLLQKTVILVK